MEASHFTFQHRKSNDEQHPISLSLSRSRFMSYSGMQLHHIKIDPHALNISFYITIGCHVCPSVILNCIIEKYSLYEMHSSAKHHLI